jgi:hypothetical protein
VRGMMNADDEKKVNEGVVSPICTPNLSSSMLQCQNMIGSSCRCRQRFFQHLRYHGIPYNSGRFILGFDDNSLYSSYIFYLCVRDTCRYVHVEI